jgi:hypothetical protein
MAGSGNLMDWTLPMVLRQRRTLSDGRVRSFWSPAEPAPRAYFRVQIPLADP